MRIAVTGRDGQVVTSLVERAGLSDKSFTVLALGRPELDLAMPETVGPALRAARPDLVVSAAAYTAVDQAEDEPEAAHAVNAAGAGAVAAAAAELGVPIIHLSTDYVFAGDLDRPYAEDDPTAPQGAYGRSKLAGEEAVAKANPHHAILRTAWVYSPFGKNFLRTMLRLAADRDEVAVVADQWGNPTSALDIADAILAMAEPFRAAPASAGVYHLAGTGSTSWAGFAREIFAASAAFGGPSAHVRDILTEAYPTKAKRPANSRLSTEKLGRSFGWQAPDWRQSCRQVVERLVGAGGR